jgi:hypothetical protein
MGILLKNIPMQPCSDNNLYFNVPNGMGRAPTKELVRFKKEMEAWGFTNYGVLQAAKEFCKNNHTLKMKIFLGIEHTRLWTLEGTVKRFDGHNWVKAMIDSLALLLSKDDKHLWVIEIEKTEVVDNEICAVYIETFKPRYYKEAIAALEF